MTKDEAMEEVKILTDDDTDRLEGAINIELSNGWKLSGELSVVALWMRDPEARNGGFGVFIFTQRMVKGEVFKYAD